MSRLRAAFAAAARPRRGSDGQVIVLFAFGLIALCAMAGLLLDGGRAFADQRQAQAAADTASLAAAAAAADGTAISGAAEDIAGMNGFDADLVDCSGATQPGKGVVVNRPPLSGPHTAALDPRASDYVEVITTRRLETTFAGVVGQDCWLVSARAVASIPSSGVAECNLCALSTWIAYRTLLIDNTANLRVDGDIYVNQDNWYSGTEAVNRCDGTNPCDPPSCDDWNGLPSDQRIRMCGDSFYIARTGGSGTGLLSARSISVNGGWQTANYTDIVHADQLADGCVYHPVALAYPQPPNVCIGMPQIPDPFNDPAHPENQIDPPDLSQLSIPIAGQDGCPAYADVPTGTLATPNKLTISGGPATSLHTICPGLYYGGFGVYGDSRQNKVTMLPGIYAMIGGGFNVTGTASIVGDGVMIFNSSGNDAFSESTVPGTNLVPPCDSGTSLCLSPVITGGGNGLSGPSTWSINTNVTFHMQLLKVSGQPKPTGTIAFYDGQDPMACVPVYGGDANHLSADCTTSYPRFGTRWITAVYSGDGVYAPTGDTHRITINPPAGEAGDNINICTGAVCGATAVCNDPTWPCSQVILHAPSSGLYAGMLFYQGRTLGLGVKLWPYVGEPTCTGTWMTDGTPGDPNPVPAPCGPLGGLSGTIYAPHQSTGASDWDAVVDIHADGLANVQIIAAQIHLTYDNDVRLTYDPSAFANGRLHLVE